MQVGSAKFRATLALLYLFIPAAHAWGATGIRECLLNGLQIDLLYGKANQKDPRLKAEGLFAGEDSNLCGPTCLATVMAKVRRVAGVESPHSSGTDEVIHITRNLAKDEGLSTRNLVENGIDDPELEILARAQMEREGINGDFKAYTIQYQDYRSRDIASVDLRRGGSSKDTYLVSVGEFITNNPDQLSPTTMVPPGHFLVPVGYDPLRPELIVFRDPENPTVLRTAVATKVESKTLDATTYRLDFEDRPKNGPTTTFILGVLRISNVKAKAKAAVESNPAVPFRGANLMDRFRGKPGTTVVETANGGKLLLLSKERLEEVPDGAVLYSVSGNKKVKGQDSMDISTMGGFTAWGLPF